MTARANRPSEAGRPRNSAVACRRGFAMFLALACLVVVAVLAATVLRQIQIWNTLNRHQQWALQSEQLAAAAVARAASRLAVNDDYAGEQWDVVVSPNPANSTGSTSPMGRASAERNGRARIEVLQTGATRTITVVADFPQDPRHRIRTRRQCLWRPPASREPTDGEPPPATTTTSEPREALVPALP